MLPLIPAETVSALPDIALRLFAACLFGGLIGFERETHGQSAGFRTHIIVALAACLMMQLSMSMEALYRPLDAQTVVRLDPSRIASYAIASMGFLGAGAIIKGRGTVRGLTTAASLWLVTGIGLAVGAGFLVTPALATGLSMIVLFFLGSVERRIRRDLHTIVTVTCRCPLTRLKDISEVLVRHKDVRIGTVTVHRDNTEMTTTYRIRLLSKNDLPRAAIMGDLMAMNNLDTVAWEEAEVP